ncbi:MAG: GNAT family N-acetyltransferase [Firmicutes bacterium]|nr:GNAT family N-acetyltransferase [Bacillota bacterium]
MYTGEKVRLREYRKEDVPKAQGFVNDPEIKRLMGGIPFPYTLWDEEKFITQQSASNNNYSFAIETLENNHYIGGCGLNSLDWKNRVAEIGIFIGDKEYQNRGYGTDALKVLLRFIFDQLNLHKVSLRVLSYNERAIKVYKRLGFRDEGCLRQERFVDGAYHDLLAMGILKDEFAEIEKESQ